MPGYSILSGYRLLFYNDFWTTMDMKEQHDSRNWKEMVEVWKAMQAVEASTNSAGAVTKGIK
jgi:hypothetical protein